MENQQQEKPKQPAGVQVCSVIGAVVGFATMMVLNIATEGAVPGGAIGGAIGGGGGAAAGYGVGLLIVGQKSQQ